MTAQIGFNLTNITSLKKKEKTDMLVKFEKLETPIMYYNNYSIAADNATCGEVPKWIELSRGFDRIVEFAETQLDKQDFNTDLVDVNMSCTTSPDSGISLGEQSSSNPPPLYRGDSPPILDGPPRTPSPNSPTPPLLTYSPAPLDGPYSPVPSSSPPSLQLSSSIASVKHQREEKHFKKKFLHHKQKFHPKGKSWQWRAVSDTEAWY